ncbi:MAG TPA: hypothetical protein VGF75_02790 [Candidatus Saccharimonadales bacterium]
MGKFSHTGGRYNPLHSKSVVRGRKPLPPSFNPDIHNWDLSPASTSGSGRFTPNIRKGCTCCFPEAIFYVHRCVPKPAFSYENVPTAPKAMQSPSGKHSYHTRSTSSNKDNLVLYSKALKTGGPIRRPTVAHKWQQTQTKPTDWDLTPEHVKALGTFKPVTTTYWSPHM